MDEQEKKLLAALVGMVRQYLDHDAEGVVDTLSMSAGEDAVAALSEYGLMEALPPTRRLGRWTKAGIEFRDQDWGHCRTS